MSSKTNPPAVGMYRPKFESIIPKVFVPYIPNLRVKSRLPSCRKNKICRRVYRCIEDPAKTKNIALRKKLRRSKKLMSSTSALRRNLISPVINS
jgi:hypothetical protein